MLDRMAVFMCNLTASTMGTMSRDVYIITVYVLQMHDHMAVFLCILKASTMRAMS